MYDSNTNPFKGLKEKDIILPFVLLFVILLTHCAKVGSPSGGEVDKTPPRVLKSYPDNYSVDFQGKKIEITFDEYIQLMELNQKLIISPPMKEKPDIRLKGKSILVDIEEELLENTTYTFNFFDAIADNNANNPLENFEFVFSTGNTIDSLSLEGKAIKAFDLQPEENVFIVVHENLDDSAFMKMIPVYVTKADEKGFFRINNMKQDTFRVFALKDANMNYMYDQPGEFIAFADTVVILNPLLHAAPDSSLTDSLSTPGITERISGINLYLFQQKIYNQYLQSSERKTANHLLFVFNEPLLRQPRIEPVNFTAEGSWYIKEYYVTGDSLSFWIRDTTISNMEFLEFEFSYLMTDSTDQLSEFKDTITLRHSEPARTRSRRRPIEEGTEETPAIPITSNTSGGIPFDLNKKIVLESPTPVLMVDTSKIHVYESRDTMKNNLDFMVLTDTLGPRKFYLIRTWKEDTMYDLRFLPGAFSDIYGLANDTTFIRFKTRNLDYYGTLMLSVNRVDQNLLVQLLNEKSEVLRENRVMNDTLIEYRYLHPGKYKLKSVCDWNSSGKWDPGNLQEKRQPEEVLLYPEEIQIRSNWEYEIDWIIAPAQNRQLPEP
ncbi:MAG: Ig-like domain-containing protein [Bacteroidales bacterium]|nr:MAG: Ig-like domain-containing protein [Bacteroidales bacterium]